MLFDTGRMLLIFVAGSAATVMGTLAAFRLLPLASLGDDGWKVRQLLGRASKEVQGDVFALVANRYEPFKILVEVAPRWLHRAMA